MRLPLVCPVCMHENIRDANISSFAEFNDTGLYEVNCEKGHQAYAVLQQQKFEILFEIGAFAIQDGYYREAVSSFTSCLERTYEFFIRAALLSEGIDSEKLESAWALVSKQSERQIGAFIFLFLAKNKDVPSVLSSRDMEFRNKVVHQGHIPTRDKTIEYGEKVLQIVRSLAAVAREKYQKGVDQVVVGHMIDNSQKAMSAGKRAATISYPTIISLSSGDPAHHGRSLFDSLSQLQRFDRS